MIVFVDCFNSYNEVELVVFVILLDYVLFFDCEGMVRGVGMVVVRELSWYL